MTSVAANERTLVSLPVSPFSERARWALDHHRLRYRTIVHEPFIGEAKLQKLVGPGKKATAPALIEHGIVIGDSTLIARHADIHGEGSPLFLSGKDAELAHWLTLANETSAAGRVLVSVALLKNGGALDETLPRRLGQLRPLLRPVTRYGTRWFARKYNFGLDAAAVAAATAAVRAGLDAVREGLHGKRYVLDEFSYADILVALLLQMVTPVQHAAYPLKPATRAAWTSPQLAKEFADLVEWRDALYTRHRLLPV